MKIQYTLIFLFFSYSIFSQGIQGTIEKTGPLQVSISSRNATQVTPASTNATVYNIGLKILKGSLIAAPTLAINSSIGGTVGSIEVLDDGLYYTYEAVVNAANYPISSPGTVTLLYTATFSSDAGGKFVRLVHDENSNNAFFDIVIPGYSNSMNSVERFYDGGLLDNNPSNAFVEAASPLPITLKSFDAKKHSASSAKLDWTTSKEVNSDYFGIERSIDGSTWDEIARVKAAGDSNVDIAYDYIDDRLPLSRTNGQVFYYRLRMTDLDGAFKYSDVRGVNFDKQSLGPISIYPNPTTEIVNIDLSEVAMENGDVNVSVYDMSGRLVMTKKIIGSGIELIKVDQLPSDAYNFIITQGEQIHQQRVIKID